MRASFKGVEVQAESDYIIMYAHMYLEFLLILIRI